MILVHLSVAEASDLRQATVISTDLLNPVTFVSFFSGSEFIWRVRLAVDLASLFPSSAAAGLLLRCLSALFDLDTPAAPDALRQSWALRRTLAAALS
jgi:hypothetical protein